MSTSRAVRQRQIYIAAGANVLFVLSLFLPWFAIGSYDSINGWSALPAPWLILLATIVAVAALFAEVYQVVLPMRLHPLGVAAYASSVPLWFTVSALLGGGGSGRDWGLVVALIASVVATVFSAQLWRGIRR